MVTLAIDTSGLVDGQGADASDVSIPINDLKIALEQTLNGLQGFDKQLFNDAGEISIDAAGSISITGGFHTVAANNGVTDNLDHLVVASRVPVYLAAKAGHSITLRHAENNIYTMDGRNLILSENRIVQVMGFDFGNGQVVMVLGQASQANSNGSANPYGVQAVNISGTLSISADEQVIWADQVRLVDSSSSIEIEDGAAIHIIS